jgi:hypothetical protein
MLEANQNWGEHGLPIRYRTYAKTFRKIARVAKIPVWNMDARAGGDDGTA